MKIWKSLMLVSLLGGLCLVPASLPAGDVKPDKKNAYPLQTCVVSGEKLGEMGKPYVFTHDGREVQLCCKGCLKDFQKDPAKYIKKLDDAEKAAAHK